MNSKNPALNSELVKKRIDNDIEKALADKGLEIAGCTSDLNVRYTLAGLSPDSTRWCGNRSISIRPNPSSHAAVSAQPDYPACLEVRPWSFWSASSAASWLV